MLATRGAVNRLKRERRDLTLQAWKIGQLAGMRSKMPDPQKYVEAWEPRELGRRRPAAEIFTRMNAWARVVNRAHKPRAPRAAK